MASQHHQQRHGLMGSSIPSIWTMILLCVGLLGLQDNVLQASAFQSSSVAQDKHHRRSARAFGSTDATGFIVHQRSTTQCHMATNNDSNNDNDNIFDNIRQFFESNSFGNSNNSSESGRKDIASNPIDEDAPAGMTRIATIPVKSIKPGGLRLFLMFYMIGMQNTPDRNSWRADQPSSDDYVVEMYYHDASAMLTVELMETEIRIDRTGSLPSMQYLMQESVIVQGILEELQMCSSDESVAEQDRLLLPEPKDAIENAMETISFG
eukprot:CAMPEP_0198116708 /NCGR_PEP_ID=MMETSP1442-20131203/14140_1 /TAXON_ID= /ORGANISM="Craspedostauros australis, Strain CCMP3328" /LENGTH=264 /DNA_ID=CAMNT_0043774597 /DNA_START=196 /DNA_END=990 /DNA_ORIENTATION=+